MDSAHRLAIATIRPPWRVDLADGAPHFSREKSSVTNLILDELDETSLSVTWFSALTQQVPDCNPSPAVHLSPINSTAEELDLAYYDFATRVLWFAYHDLLGEYPLQSRHTAVDGSFSALAALSTRFARQIYARCPKTAVLVNDYQLCLLPGELRELDRNCKIVHVSYTAFAKPSTWAMLPERVQGAVMQGMLGADILLFCADLWIRRFVLCAIATVGAKFDEAADILRHPWGSTKLGLQPIFANPKKLERLLRESEERPVKDDRLLIARSDRLDPTKNILQSLAAFQRLLRSATVGPDDVCFRACLVPTRNKLHEYRLYAERVEELSAEINATFPDSVELLMGDDHPRALRTLTEADVVIANSRADGMNLSLQEAILVNQRGFSAIASSAMGSSRLFGPTVVQLSKPDSISHTFESLTKALKQTPIERRAMNRLSRQILTKCRGSLIARCNRELRELEEVDDA